MTRTLLICFAPICITEDGWMDLSGCLLRSRYFCDYGSNAELNAFIDRQCRANFYRAEKEVKPTLLTAIDRPIRNAVNASDPDGA